MPTVPAKLLLRHESQAHASSAAVLTLEEGDEGEEGDRLPRRSARLSDERWRFTLGCDQMLLPPTDQWANGKP